MSWTNAETGEEYTQRGFINLIVQAGGSYFINSVKSKKRRMRMRKEGLPFLYRTKGGTYKVFIKQED